MLKILHLSGFSIETLNLPCTLPPNLTSLFFEYVEFCPTNLSDYVVDVPMLENLTFSSCKNIFHFKITARKLCSLTIKYFYRSELSLSIDLKSICTLELDSYSVQTILGTGATMGHRLQQNVLNVELLKLSALHLQRGVETSAFVSLLCICPKLHELEICFWGTEDTTKATDTTSKRLKKLCSVVQTYERLHILKFASFRGFKAEMLFIKEMLAGVPSLERVIFMGTSMYEYDSYKKHEIIDEVLCFPRASTEVKIVY
ncbi:unnamed protein product [Cuscuta epithymum]|uniref:FBD domain-containing protein n=1 Tax=Cuscuta epithymum TaxID=186058 RepID=A0AAV0EP71_9ASTE|nr:unnamed protein product [Cuscuta epithymum]